MSDGTFLINSAIVSGGNVETVGITALLDITDACDAEIEPLDDSKPVYLTVDLKMGGAAAVAGRTDALPDNNMIKVPLTVNCGPGVLTRIDCN